MALILVLMMMMSSSMGSEMIMAYTGSLFLVKQGCPNYPAYYHNTIDPSRSAQLEYSECLKKAAGEQVSDECLLSSIVRSLLALSMFPLSSL